MKLFRKKNEKATMESVWENAARKLDILLKRIAAYLNSQVNTWSNFLKWSALVLFVVQWLAIIALIIYTGNDKTSTKELQDTSIRFNSPAKYDSIDRLLRNGQLNNTEEQLERYIDSLNLLYDSLQRTTQ
ncbi:hypothetical protein [Pinibacter aurantiacus]|uniref:Uncharacterized protein n=1 Tax=Pinibacter aurantiacus TaxID=2851599 RepID=A0A9E2W8W8_9BACT|nr:hypothetical protein [Pinibacter aurantiacus]MBV4358802.1 hypothetical protein [Pinibacter aurantiacus]